MGLFRRLFPKSEAPDSYDFPSCIAAIEAVRIDDRTYFYAYSDSEDRVVSPIFSEPDGMAKYAESMLAHRDGEHDAAYWLEMAELATGPSELRSVEKSEIDRFVELLMHAESSGEYQPDIPRIDFLTYKIFSIGREWSPQPDWSACNRELEELGLEHDEVYDNTIANTIDYIAGESDWFDDGHVTAAAKLVRVFVSTTLMKTHPTWRSAFPQLVMIAAD